MVNTPSRRILIRLNGAEREIDASTTVATLLSSFGLPERGVAVEVSGEVVPRGRWTVHTLREGDRVELVHMVGGGA